MGNFIFGSNLRCWSSCATDKELGASELEQLVKEADVECIIYHKVKDIHGNKERGETSLKYRSIWMQMSTMKKTCLD